MFNVATGATCVFGAIQLYRWTPDDALYSPDSSWYTVGRFGDGTHKTLYLAESAEGAMAEFLRRNPEFMDLQDALIIRLYQVELELVGPCLDVRTSAERAIVGVTLAALTSSDTDETIRYADSRALAADVIASSRGLIGIAYPSAAAVWDTWNIVLFGDPTAGTWSSQGFRHVIPAPILNSSQVHALR